MHRNLSHTVSCHKLPSSEGHRLVEAQERPQIMTAFDDGATLACGKRGGKGREYQG